MALAHDSAPVLIQTIDDMNKTCSQLERLTKEIGVISESIRVARKISSRRRILLDAARKELRAKRDKLEKLKREVRTGKHNCCVSYDGRPLIYRSYC